MPRHYGPPRRTPQKQVPPQLEALENYTNTQVASEYLPQIKAHLSQLEASSGVNVAMIDLQPEVKWFMRPYLVNFLIQMHASLRLKPQTLFLTWNIIDRYCAKRIAFKQHYQLIGCTALWIAAKYEDKKSRVPTIGELAMMCSNVYEESMFREMEVHILSTLGWNIGHTSLEDVIQLCVKATDPDGKETLRRPLAEYRGNSQTVSAILAVSRYLCELSLYERDFLLYTPSLVGTTAFLVACQMLEVGTKYLQGLVYSVPQKGATVPPYLASPVTPRKGFFSSSVSSQSDPLESSTFLSGFDASTLPTLHTIAALLLKSLLNPPEVLSEKYTPLGVTAVVDKFVAEHALSETTAESVAETLLEVPEDSLVFSCPSPMTTRSTYSSLSSPSNGSSFSSASSQTTYDSCYDATPRQVGKLPFD